MDLELKGRRVLITGGSKGIGLATARSFAAEGCALELVGRNVGDLEKARSDLTAETGVAVNIHALDMAKGESAKELGRRCADIDILVNNAGALPRGNVMEISEEAWLAAWGAKVFGYINLTREILPHMIGRGSGVIVNIVGLIGEKPTWDAVCRGTANAALMAFTKAVGAGSVDKGVRVFGVNPGTILTEKSEVLARTRAKDELGDPERWPELFKKSPRGRLGHTSEIADVVVFLASGRASYVSGTIINVDAGSLYRA